MDEINKFYEALAPQDKAIFDKTEKSILAVGIRNVGEEGAKVLAYKLCLFYMKPRLDRLMGEIGKEDKDDALALMEEIGYEQYSQSY